MRTRALLFHHHPRDADDCRHLYFISLLASMIEEKVVVSMQIHWLSFLKQISTLSVDYANIFYFKIDLYMHPHRQTTETRRWSPSSHDYNSHHHKQKARMKKRSRRMFQRKETQKRKLGNTIDTIIITTAIWNDRFSIIVSSSRLFEFLPFFTDNWINQ